MNFVFLVLGVVGAIPFFIYVHSKLRVRGSLHRVLKFKPDTPVDVVMTTSGNARSKQGAASSSRLLTPEGEVLALATIGRCLGTAYRHKSMRIHLSERVANELLGDTIIVGGPAANRWARAFLETAPFAVRNRLWLDASQGSISIGGEERSIDDFGYVRGVPSRDLALIVVTDSWFSKGARAVLCAGLTSYGSGAAVEILFRDIPTGVMGPSTRSCSRAALYECELSAGRPVRWTELVAIDEP